MKRQVRRFLSGEVVKLSGNKTAKIRVEERQSHSLYKKVVSTTKLYLAHFEGEAPELGSVVSIMSCRPLSKNKRWIISKG